MSRGTLVWPLILVIALLLGGCSFAIGFGDVFMGARQMVSNIQTSVGGHVVIGVR